MLGDEGEASCRRELPRWLAAWRFGTTNRQELYTSFHMPHSSTSHTQGGVPACAGRSHQQGRGGNTPAEARADSACQLDAAACASVDAERRTWAAERAQHSSEAAALRCGHSCSLVRWVILHWRPRRQCSWTSKRMGASMLPLRDGRQATASARTFEGTPLLSGPGLLMARAALHAAPGTTPCCPAGRTAAQMLL